MSDAAMAYPEELRSGVYCILNLVNGKHYIGSSMNVSERIKCHTKLLMRGSHHSKKLQNSWNVHGFENFRFDILEFAPVSLLQEREQFFIDNTIPFYNIYRSAYTPRGHKHSDETRAKFREAQSRRSPEWNRKISEGNKGKVRGEKALENYRAVYAARDDDGKRATVEKMIEARKGVPVSDGGKERIAYANARNFIAISPNGTAFEVTNLTKFCKLHGLDRTCMTRVSVGQTCKHKGWVCINPRLKNKFKENV